MNRLIKMAYVSGLMATMLFMPIAYSDCSSQSSTCAGIESSSNCCSNVEPTGDRTGDDHLSCQWCNNACVNKGSCTTE